LKIVIDATTLLLRSAGVKNYLHYWLLSLMASAPQVGDTIATYPFAVDIAALPDHERPSPGRLGTFARLLQVRLGNIAGSPLLEVTLLGADLFHSSQHTARLPRRKKSTATIFDFSCWTTPEHHTPENVAATKHYADHILKASDGLIAISAHAGEDAVAILRIPRDRIRVIYPGVAEPFFCVTPTEACAVRKRLQLHAPYFLFVGCIEPRKNVPGLIRAYQQLPETFRRDAQLVIAGPFGWASESVRHLLMSSGNNVRYLGYVPEADLPGLIRGAIGLVYPSYYEGFGLPVAQAMAAGIPVIGSDRGSVPEVIGDGGLCVNPDSTDELSSAMQRIATDSELSGSLAAEGKLRASRFRWEACASESNRFFHEIIGR